MDVIVWIHPKIYLTSIGIGIYRENGDEMTIFYI